MTAVLEEPVLQVGDRQVAAFLLRGHMRSGTNWTCSVLNLHPKIRCEGEFHFQRIVEAIDTFADRPWMRDDPSWKDLGRDHVAGFVRSCLARIAVKHASITAVGDRTPAPLDPELPGAPVIHITRDGRDVLVSWAFHALRMGAPQKNPEIEQWRIARDGRSESMLEMPHALLDNETVVRARARRWSSMVQHDHAFIRQARLGEVPHRVMPITYEGLHADVEGVRSQMYAFLGLDPAEAAPVSIESKTDAGFGSRNEDPNNFYRAGKVGGWERYFTDDVKSWFKDEAGNALIEAGYENDLNW